ncbi:serine/threonine-protein kinase [Streptomyces fractus]|uniref:serine/threonine-protein kinase n=1 Tax=Streptomyces fractus TaxID=641806 RepID=UPI003CF40080
MTHPSPYTARKVIGTDALTVLWSATGPDGPVAVALLHAEIADPVALMEDFHRSHRHLLTVRNPHLVSVRDTVAGEGRAGLVMDLVHGISLERALHERGPLSPADAVSVTADIAEALQEIHAVKIFHTDVTPANILLDFKNTPPDGSAPPALLTSLGLRVLADPLPDTAQRLAIASGAYLAPEVVEGLQTRGPADVYALTACLYEMLTGSPPFGISGDPGVMRRHVMQEPGRPAGCPEFLWEIMRSCLAKVPAARLRAGELAQQLRQIVPALEGMAYLAPPGAFPQSRSTEPSDSDAGPAQPLVPHTPVDDEATHVALSAARRTRMIAKAEARAARTGASQTPSGSGPDRPEAAGRNWTAAVTVTALVLIACLIVLFLGLHT